MKSPCLEPRCGGFAVYRGRCAAHAKQRDKQIDRAGRSIYNTKRWKILRRRKLAMSPLCERCANLAEHVHHRHGVEVDPWSLTGLESLCASCHSRETRKEQMRGSDA